MTEYVDCPVCGERMTKWVRRGQMRKACSDKCGRRVRYAADPEKLREANRKHREANPEKYRELNSLYAQFGTTGVWPGVKYTAALTRLFRDTIAGRVGDFERKLKEIDKGRA